MEPRHDVPDILVVNDDGYNAAGFRILIDILSSAGYRVVGVSTSDASSGTAKSLSFSYKVRRVEIGSTDVYIIDGGTPATAVLHMFYKEGFKPRLVVSGINHGANMGLEDILSSGTVGAVIESVLHGVPGIAFSKYLPAWSPRIDLGTLTERHKSLILHLVDLLLQATESCEYPECMAYNVNLPQEEPRELVLSIPAYRVYDNISIQYRAGAYRLSSSPQFYRAGTDECTDVNAVLAGKASITSLSWLYSRIVGGCSRASLLVRELILNEPPPPPVRLVDCWGSREWGIRH